MRQGGGVYSLLRQQHPPSHRAPSPICAPFSHDPPARPSELGAVAPLLFLISTSAPSSFTNMRGHSDGDHSTRLCGGVCPHKHLLHLRLHRAFSPKHGQCHGNLFSLPTSKWSHEAASWRGVFPILSTAFTSAHRGSWSHVSKIVNGF